MVAHTCTVGRWRGSLVMTAGSILPAMSKIELPTMLTMYKMINSTTLSVRPENHTNSISMATLRMARPSSIKMRSLPNRVCSLSIHTARNGSMMPSNQRVAVKMMPATPSAMP